MANQSLTSVAINVNSSGDNTLIAGAAGKIIRVLNFALFPATAVACKFTDGPGGAALTGPMNLGTTGLYPGWAPTMAGGFTIGHFETSAGNALVLNLGAGTQVCGYINYILAPQ